MFTYAHNDTICEHQKFFFDPLESPHSSRILVIDDEVSFRNLAQDELEERRFSVYAAEGTVLVKVVVNSFNPDLVLLDLYMHGNQGWNILSACKKAFPDIPVLIYTAFDSFSHDPRFCLADGLIVKSIHFERLIETIIAALHVQPRRRHPDRFPASDDRTVRPVPRIQ